MGAPVTNSDEPGCLKIIDACLQRLEMNGDIIVVRVHLKRGERREREIGGRPVEVSGYAVIPVSRGCLQRGVAVKRK